LFPAGGVPGLRDDGEIATNALLEHERRAVSLAGIVPCRHRTAVRRHPASGEAECQLPAERDSSPGDCLASGHDAGDEALRILRSLADDPAVLDEGVDVL